MRINLSNAFALLVYGLVLFIQGADTPADEVSFNRDIRPLLSNRCFACHGPDEETRESGLRLDQADGDGGAIGLAIEPGSLEDSELWNRITSDDESEIMPPPDSHLKPFSAEEQGLIKRWIESGANYEKFWAFETPVKPASPSVKDVAWSANDIDRFVLRKLETLECSPSSKADPRTLIRRVTLDLTGLPPTRAEIEEFLGEHQQSPDDAWEKVVDRLLARPQYGEHIGRYWLDLVRFADSNGMHKDFYRNHVAYRDWVIRAFNENLGYDDFLRYQLAGDLYSKPTRDQLVASGFHRLHLIIDRGTALPEESFAKNVIDRVTSVSTAFMGLTVQCAQCHDHKFDPITQKDFYALSAFLNNIDAKPETAFGPGHKRGLQQPFVSFANPQQESKLKRLDRKIKNLNRNLKKAEEAAQNKSAKEQSSKNADAGDKRVSALAKQLKEVQKEKSELEMQIPMAMVMKERKEVRSTFVLERGQYDAPGEEVQRNTPEFLPELKTSGNTPSRMDLANWFVDPENPLTSRVAVNRIWQQFFGVGLVKTSEDFGNQGDVPSHPELLDYLAVTFVESGWDTKGLIKEIAMSKTYRQSSVASPDQYQADSENRMLSRGSRFRLDAEVIRDQILSSSGLLSEKMYGPSVKPPQPDGLWAAVSMIGERYQPDSGEAIRRRSVYTFWKRSMPPPQMTILNAPLRDSCVARRERTNTATQALLLLNESEYLKASRQLALEVLKQPDEKRIEAAWETVTSQLPDDKEKEVLQQLLADLGEKYSSNKSLVEDLLGDLKPPQLPGSDNEKVELAAWTILANTLFNMDITKTRN
jgi:hypothetical protein